jgi:hypothetical protein
MMAINWEIFNTEEYIMNIFGYNWYPESRNLVFLVVLMIHFTWTVY